MSSHATYAIVILAMKKWYLCYVNQGGLPDEAP